MSARARRLRSSARWPVSGSSTSAMPAWSGLGLRVAGRLVAGVVVAIGVGVHLGLRRRRRGGGRRARTRDAALGLRGAGCLAGGLLDGTPGFVELGVDVRGGAAEFGEPLAESRGELRQALR